jgi:hypothetical protein
VGDPGTKEDTCLTASFSFGGRHLDMWCSYLETEFKKSIAKDTWSLTLDFALQVRIDRTVHASPAPA